jgi:hypothetical protein
LTTKKPALPKNRKSKKPAETSSMSFGNSDSIQFATQLYDSSQVRDSCVLKSTRRAYRSNLNGISKWIRASQENHEQFIDDDGTINLHVFTAAHFEQFFSVQTQHPRKIDKSWNVEWLSKCN